MKKLLVINASARMQRSHSREMTATFVENWKERQPDSVIAFRELGTINVPHMTGEWISAAFKPAASRTEADVLALGTSDIFVSELKEADVIVIGAPMYNWSIPSPLKAYIDQVMRIHETWKPNPADKTHPYTGLLQNKTLVLLLARGAAGYEPGEYNEHMNFQSTYLKTVFNIMGIKDIHVISINGASTPSDELTSAIDNSKREIRTFIDRHLERDHSIHSIINY
ncbi:NAD(P)H-dependent oxidoreductase [Dyadobacter sp. CY261]|uniref:FMN-dependent NADH-azoreductase n=1 Tax=Dyadobacter sp. CY261 TaxID=2907203 RepID=UPI001F244C14|nr:NAD(P)H-dependent oxidoreductase [Dyadobacter sp. CY261]MCF0069524.1 NAD(P)H-dependent oxidoreductase [Dyadobacter sp. CY261]